MHSRKLLILTIVVAALGAYIFFVDRKALSTDERREQEKKALVLEEDGVRALEIAWDDRKVRLERRDPPEETEDDKKDKEKGDIFAEPEPTWEIVEPVKARADRAAVTGLLSRLTDLEKSRTLEDPDRSALGFDDPRGSVTIETDDGETRLEVGPDVPASSDMLIAIGEEISIVPNSIWSDLTKDPGDWRDKQIFSASRSKIERVTLRSGGERVLLARRGEDFWIESPVVDLADESLVGGLLSDLTGLRAERFVDEPGAVDLGLDGTDQVIEVELAGEPEPFRLELGNSVDGGAVEGSERIYARAGPQLAEISTKLTESLARGPRDWLSRDWTPLQPFRVQSGRFEDAAGAVDVELVDSEWTRGGEKVAYSAVSDVLYAIADAKAAEVLGRGDAEARGHTLADPVLSITLETEDDSQSLVLYPSAEDGLSAAIRDGRDAVLLLPSEAVDELTSKLADLRAAEPEVADDAADEAAEDDEPG